MPASTVFDVLAFESVVPAAAGAAVLPVVLEASVVLAAEAGAAFEGWVAAGLVEAADDAGLAVVDGAFTPELAGFAAAAGVSFSLPVKTTLDALASLAPATGALVGDEMTCDFAVLAVAGLAEALLVAAVGGLVTEAEDPAAAAADVVGFC